jgi:predicted small lipoprotein YifL
LPDAAGTPDSYVRHDGHSTDQETKMKRILNHRPWLVPAVLAAAALVACGEDGRVQPSNFPESTIDAPDTSDGETTTTTGCSNPQSAQDFLPGSRHIPKC